jgi:hypothetical protein
MGEGKNKIEVKNTKNYIPKTQPINNLINA